MFSSLSKLQFPLWKFLNQPIFDDRSKTVLNPRLFWRLHTIELLERCLVQDATSRDRRRE